MKNAWDAVVGWVTNNQLIVGIGAFLLFVLGIKKIIGDIKHEAKHAERAATAVKQAEVKIRVNERSTEIINEERDHAQDAIEARDSSPLYPTFDELPDAHKRILDRSRRGGEAS